MLTESYFASISGPPIANNTAISKDAGVYEHTLFPSHATSGVLKKSSSPPNCLAVSDTHVFAAQADKAAVHVYSRAKGNQEALVTLPERVCTILLLGDVLVLGTAEGRLLIWEVSIQRMAPCRAVHVSKHDLQRCRYALED
jgi:pre-rRNA-processing protein IPI3